MSEAEGGPPSTSQPLGMSMEARGVEEDARAESKGRNWVLTGGLKLNPNIASTKSE